MFPRVWGRLLLLQAMRYRPRCDNSRSLCEAHRETPMGRASALGSVGALADPNLAPSRAPRPKTQSAFARERQASCHYANASSHLERGGRPIETAETAAVLLPLGLPANRAGVHVDFETDGQLDDLRSLPGHFTFSSRQVGTVSSITE